MPALLRRCQCPVVNGFNPRRMWWWFTREMLMECERGSAGLLLRLQRCRQVDPGWRVGAVRVREASGLEDARVNCADRSPRESRPSRLWQGQGSDQRP